MEHLVHQFLVTIPKYEINFQLPFIEHTGISIKNDTRTHTQISGMFEWSP